jgi:5-oxoprolinase (ATP-hydrolysing)
MVERSFKFSIDRGGTFTDVFCECADGKQRIMKLLSEDPSNYRDAPTEGIRRILEEETGVPHPRDGPVDTSRIQYIRMGTTVATNALLERKGESTALITTKGFKDLQYIGNQSRPKIFELNIRRPDVLFEYVEELDERVVLLKEGEYTCDNPEDIVIGVSQEALCIEKSIDEAEVRSKLEQIRAKGISCIAVALMHSYTFPAHEKCVERVARELGFTQVSLSSTIMPMVRLVPRGCTTCVDAYLTPVLKRYLSSFCSGFDDGLADVTVSFMQSDGGLTSMNTFLGNRSILSGPAGNVSAYTSQNIFFF